MYTIGTLFDEIAADIVNSRFKLNCTSIKLVQNTLENAIEIEGAGIVYWDKHDQLKVTIIPNDTLTLQQYLDAQTLSCLKPGVRVIPKEKYFNLVAVDSRGFAWVAENIVFHSGFGVGVKEYDLSINKLSLSTTPSNQKDSIFRYLVIGDFNDYFPYNKHETTEVNGMPTSTLNTFTTELNHKINYSLKNRGTYITIEIEGETLNNSIAQLILESTSIAIGILINPTISQVLDTIVIESKYNISDSAFLNTPIPHMILQQQFGVQSLTHFINCYCNKFRAQNTDFFRYWVMIYLSRNATIHEEVKQVALAISIEGILNTYFYHDKIEIPQYDINASELAIGNCNIHSALKKRLLDTARNSTSIIPSISQKLKYLKKNHGVNVKYKKWAAFRNSRAHGNLLDRSTIHNVSEDYNFFLNFYYILLCIHIEYSGKIEDSMNSGIFED